MRRSVRNGLAIAGMAGGVWFLATAFCYSAVLLPGFIVHAFCVWSAYQCAKDWRGY